MVNPGYYVGFSTCTLVASAILLDGFKSATAKEIVTLASGLVSTCIGVLVLVGTI